MNRPGASDVNNKEKIENIIFKLVEQDVAIMWITHSDDQDHTFSKAHNDC